MDPHALTSVSAGLAALLALVLAVAAFGKFRTSQATLEALDALALPRFLRRRWVAVAVPVTEAVLATALLAAPSWLFLAALTASTLLFAIFWRLVARAVAREEQAACNCFGQDSSAMTVHTVSRNLALTAGTGLALLASTLGALLSGTASAAGALPWQDSWLAGIAVALAGLVGWWGIRAAGRDAAEADTSRVESVRNAEGLGLRTVDGKLYPLARSARSGAVLLLFIQAGQDESQRIMQAALAWRGNPGLDIPGARRLKIVVNESEHARAIPPTLGPEDVLLDSSRASTRLAGIQRYPAAVLIGHDATFAVDPVIGADSIEALLADLDEVWPRSASQE